MGQKVNPIGMRIGIIRDWDAKWYASKTKVADLLHEDLKIAHTYTFLTKNFYGFETVFCIMILGFSPYFICVLCRAKISPQIYTRIIASLKPPPPYTRIIREENFAPRYI